MIFAFDLRASWVPQDQLPAGLERTGSWAVFFATIFKTFIWIGVSAAIIVFFISAFRLITTQGSEAEYEKAKKSMAWALIGILVMIFAYSLVNVVLRTPVTNPQSVPTTLPPVTPAP